MFARLVLSLWLALLPAAAETGFGAVSEGTAASPERLPAERGEILMAARPNPYNRGNCFQWKKCRGESIGNMWVDSPDFCGPLGGKSWKGRDGKCRDLLDVPWEDDPRRLPSPSP